MGKSVEAAITPDLLVWARKSAGLSKVEAAQRLHIGTELLSDWEAGESRPTVAKMRKVAALYRRPLALFYLPHRPLDFQPMHDFRRLPEAGHGVYSPGLLYEIRLAHERRNLALEVLSDEGTEAPQFILSAALGDHSEVVGRNIREALGVTYALQSHWRNPRIAFHAWRSRIEDAGVLVFQAARFETKEASGFAYSADTLPFMVVNQKDPWGRRVFSLLHELVHLMLETSGVSDLSGEVYGSRHVRQIEIFCNKTAAAALMPRLQFLGEPIIAEGTPNSEEWTDSAIGELSRVYGVSREAVVRRLLTFGLTTEAFYIRKRAQYLEEFKRQQQRAKEAEKRTQIRRNVPREAIAEVGKPLLRMLLGQFHSDRLSLSELSGQLGVKAKHIDRIEQGTFVD